MNKFHKILDSKPVLFADGATGTNLFSKGMEAGYSPELWNLEKPNIIKELHEDFIKSGSDIILTNSFGANSSRLKLHNLENDVDKLNFEAANLAKKAIVNNKDNLIVAGSIGPTGELFEPLGNLNKEEAISIFSKQSEFLFKGGVDIFWIETMSSLEEVEAAVLAVKKFKLPIICTMSFDTARKTMMGVDPIEFKKFAYDFKLDGYGANCGVGPAELLDTVCDFNIEKSDKIPVVAKANCGIPELLDGKTHYKAFPKTMANYSKLAKNFNVKIIGGCCGTTADHVKEMVESTDLYNKINNRYNKNSICALLGTPWENLNKIKNERKKRVRKRK